MSDRPPGRTVLAAVAVVSLATAGCLGAGPTAPSMPTPTPTPTPTPSPTANTDCPPALTVYELDAEPADRGSAVAYGNLTAAQRETFDRARNGSVEGFDYAWHDVDVVVHEGTYYRASVVVC
ncbi:hypothetical protein EI982_07580 [Haloplanus rallus]|uniref:DUF7979 domain-containing protein n=1 Tax=Haloplanus rallus TaxID=1816183 RepID=A0A6B9FFN7_9EURY|nr:hypothetical protein [Haloplanus rallus]QGX94663.1 hypothetical protein EI982_07580 [Haloplanus rallus]